MPETPKVGTHGVIVIGGLRAHYTDIPMSGDLLKDNPHCPDWVEDGKVYWVRHSIAGMQVLGPVLNVVEDSLTIE